LSIARRLGELPQGSLRAESEGLGCGATFVVRIPIAAGRDAQVTPVPPVRVEPPMAPTALDGVRILVVDDEVDARDILRLTLEACGAEVSVAESVEEAMSLFERGRFDLIVTDLAMPGEDGYALVSRIRRAPAGAGARTPIVALTAYARAEDRTRALRAGFNMHIPKPVESAELLAVVASLVPARPR
jgi:CheY-like chemotaxis protein